jgi:hypothetical protein
LIWQRRARRSIFVLSRTLIPYKKGAAFPQRLYRKLSNCAAYFSRFSREESGSAPSSVARL